MSKTAIDRRGALRLGLLGVAAIPLLSRAAFAAGDASAVPPVQAFGGALLAIMKAGAATPFTRRYAMIEPAVASTFDLDVILRVSVGPHWTGMAPDQQAALTNAFHRYTVANFVANFDSYAGQSIQVEPAPRTLANGDEVVTTRIGAPAQSPVVLSYVMRRTPAGWRAVDVLADGSISRVATQRSDFRSLLSSGGGPALVASLQSKVAALSGGSLA